MVSPGEIKELNAEIAGLTVGTGPRDRAEVAVGIGGIRARIVPVGVLWRLEVPLADGAAAILGYGRAVRLQDAGDGLRLCVGDARSDGYHVKGYLVVPGDVPVSVEGVSRCSR